MTFVLVERPDPAVAVVTLNRPERMNAVAPGSARAPTRSRPAPRPASPG